MGKNIAKTALVLSIILCLVCLVSFSNTNNDYIIAKGESARHKIQSIYNNPFNYDDNYKTETQKELETTRSLCIVGIIGSIIIAIFSIVVIASPTSESKKTVDSKISISQEGNNTAPSIADEITKLHSLKEQGILTQEEFQTRKKQLLEK